MEITSKEMTTTKSPLINLMITVYFTYHQKEQLVDFFKEVSMHYLCKNLP